MKYLTTAALLVVGVCSGAFVRPNTEGRFELLILHNNDMHARFEQTSYLSGACTKTEREAGKCYGGFARVAYVVNKAREDARDGKGPPVLYLNAGDTYTGTAWFTIYKWQIAAEFINALQPDAVSLGNHEFDEGVDGLTPFIRNVTTPVLASNLDLTKVPQLEKEENLKPYIIRNIGGRSIAIIGYLTSETKFLAPTNDVEYKDEVEAIQHYVNLLKKEGVRIFIAVGHSGILKDMEIARKVEGLHLVIGGHSNTFLTNEESDNFPVDPEGPYPLLVTQESGRVVRVVQAYAYTMYLGKLHLVFDDNDEIIDAFGDPILLDNSIPEDPELKKKVDKYRAEMNDSNVIVGSSMESLRGDYCRVRECSMGNLITDAMYNFTESKYPEMCKADVAILQGGRIRTSLDNPEKPFNMYLQDWLSVLPFTDPLTLVTMNGTVLMQVLEHSVSGWRLIDSPGMFLQMSGIKVSYDLGKPSGSRIIEAQARTCRNGLQPIMKETQYKVLMPNFIANGGDGYSMFKDLDMEILAFNEVDSVRYYLSLYSPVNVKETDRIVIKNEDVINKKTMIQLRDEQMNSSQTKALPYSMMCLTAMMVLPQCKYLLNTS